jgi:hypothetical protein
MDSSASKGNCSHESAADLVTSAIIGSAIEVHRELGPGLLESSYEACLAHELATRGFDVNEATTRNTCILQGNLPGLRLSCRFTRRGPNHS